MTHTDKALVGHQAVVDWMGTRVRTLADLIPSSPRAIVVGINPAPRSVEVGHYYQGQLGQQFFGRLRSSGVLDTAEHEWEDDAAYASGIGFTDVIKRPTRSADELSAEEYAFGIPALRERIEHSAPRLVIFTFKKTAEKLLGRFEGSGRLAARLGDAAVFVMPAPYAAGSIVMRQLADLREVFD